MDIRALKMIREFAGWKHYRAWYQQHWDRVWIRRTLSEYVSAQVFFYSFLLMSLVILIGLLIQLRGAI